MSDKKKTDLDVFEAIIGMTMGDLAPVAVQEFRQMVLPISEYRGALKRNTLTPSSMPQ